MGRRIRRIVMRQACRIRQSFRIKNSDMCYRTVSWLSKPMEYITTGGRNFQVVSLVLRTK